MLVLDSKGCAHDLHVRSCWDCQALAIPPSSQTPRIKCKDNSAVAALPPPMQSTERKGKHSDMDRSSRKAHTSSPPAPPHTTFESMIRQKAKAKPLVNTKCLVLFWRHALGRQCILRQGWGELLVARGHSLVASPWLTKGGDQAPTPMMHNS